MKSRTSFLTLAGTIYLIYRVNKLERQLMKQIDDLDRAVEAIDAETTALGDRVTQIQTELAAAKDDPARVEMAANHLGDIASRLKQMATATPTGGVNVPQTGELGPLNFPAGEGSDAGDKTGDTGLKAKPSSASQPSGAQPTGSLSTGQEDQSGSGAGATGDAGGVRPTDVGQGGGGTGGEGGDAGGDAGGNG